MAVVYHVDQYGHYHLSFVGSNYIVHVMLILQTLWNSFRNHVYELPEWH